MCVLVLPRIGQQRHITHYFINDVHLCVCTRMPTGVFVWALIGQQRHSNHYFINDAHLSVCMSMGGCACVTTCSATKTYQSLLYQWRTFVCVHAHDYGCACLSTHLATKIHQSLLHQWRTFVCVHAHAHGCARANLCFKNQLLVPARHLSIYLPVCLSLSVCAVCKFQWCGDSAGGRKRGDWWKYFDWPRLSVPASPSACQSLRTGHADSNNRSSLIYDEKKGSETF